MLEQVAVPHVERLVVDEQTQQLAVGDVDDRLTAFRITEARFGIRQRTDFVERVQVGARQTVWFALIEIAAKSDVTVRQREQRFGLVQPVEVELGFADMPGFNGKCAVVLDHRGNNSARSVTTTSAPLRRNASA